MKTPMSLFSQNGEDISFAKMISKNVLPPEGFYVDLGAFHPFVYSNTCLLSKLGWRGINIDANPNVINLFNQL